VADLSGQRLAVVRQAVADAIQRLPTADDETVACVFAIGAECDVEGFGNGRVQRRDSPSLDSTVDERRRIVIDVDADGGVRGVVVAVGDGDAEVERQVVLVLAAGYRGVVRYRKRMIEWRVERERIGAIRVDVEREGRI